MKTGPDGSSKELRSGGMSGGAQLLASEEGTLAFSSILFGRYRQRALAWPIADLPS